MADRPRLVIVDDDPAFARAMRRSFERRSYEVRACETSEALEEALCDFRPGFAIVDLKLGGDSGLRCVRRLAALDPAMRIVC